LKDVLALLQRSHDINPNAFEDYILQLYRKQEIDLQPGGDPAEYHLHSPTRKEFYYLIPHNAPAESGSAKKD